MNILTYLFLFYSHSKKPTIWQRPRTDGNCPLPESTSVYRRNLRSCSSKRMPQTGIFPQTAIVMDLRGNKNNVKMQRKCFSVQQLHCNLQYPATKSMGQCYLNLVTVIMKELFIFTQKISSKNNWSHYIIYIWMANVRSHPTVKKGRRLQ